jgi:hypothetical protein
MSLGMIAIKWAHLEMALAQYYARLVLGEEHNGQVKRIVIEALESVPTWYGKCKILTSATELRFDHKTAKELGKLLYSIKDIQDDRNEVLHGRWHVSEEAPGKWIHSASALGPMKAYDQACLLQISSDINAAMVELHNFFMAIKKRLKDDASRLAMEIEEMLANLDVHQDQNTVENNLGGT